MDDLFAPSAPPTYGSLSHSAERNLHDSDRAAWIAYVCRAMAAKLSSGGEAVIRHDWPMMRRDYQVAVWAHLSEETRAMVKATRAEAA